MRYLGSAEGGLKLAATLNLSARRLCHAFLTQLQEARYPPKQGAKRLLELSLLLWTLPQMSAQHTLLGDGAEAQRFGGKVVEILHYQDDMSLSLKSQNTSEMF